MFVTATKSLRPTLLFFAFVAFCLVFASCSTVKDYPVHQPFVYQYNVELNDKFSKDERKQLLERLENQLHDSIRVRRLQKLIFWNTLNKPPVYDSLNADKSVIYMRALLNSLGYYRDTITYDTTLNVVRAGKGTQLRTTVNFDVFPGRLITLDSISYNFGGDTVQNIAQSTKDTLQKVTDAAHNQTLLKKGSPFAIALISAERDRLTDVYRNNGYLRFSSEELIALWDTLGVDLLRPTLDPIEQAQQLEALRERRLNPTADLEIRLRANEDTSHLTRYYVGNVTIYPDLAIDTANYIPEVSMYNGYKVIAYRNLYKNKVLVENMYLNRGDLYSQRNYLKTINRFNAIGSWRVVTVDQVPRGATDTVDFTVRLTPSPKYSFNANIEGSQSLGRSSDNALPIGNLIGFNIGLQNRNFSHGANLATTNFRFATEVLNQQYGRSKLITFSNAIYFPRAIPHLNFIPAEWKENMKTVFSVNANYTNRKKYFEPYQAFNGSWGYEFNWKNKLLGVRLPNIEYSLLTPGDTLKKLMANNVSYKYIYNSGLVTSVIASFTLTGGEKNVTNITRLNFESSGLITGIFRNTFLKENLHRFIKLDADFRQTHKIRRSDFAWRIFAGAGYQLGSKYFENNKTLPFFKSYFAGGANSMRAWQLRKLGPGSVVRSFSPTEAPERYGDIQIEANAEYRFYIADIQGVTLNSALFTDIGNIWNMRSIDGNDAGIFKPGKLWTDLAIGSGTGLRIDFGFFLIRLDYAYKVKDPSPDEFHKQNKWFYNWKLLNGQPQLGVTYPF